MIDLWAGELKDTLPGALDDTDMECLSAAIREGAVFIMMHADSVRTMSMIRALPERILDIVAMEMRAPYYDESLDLDAKQTIVTSTFLWHCRSGTPAAVCELVNTVFGQGRVIEWFDPEFEWMPELDANEETDQSSGLFDIETDAPMMSDVYEQLSVVIDYVKNCRSHLRKVVVTRRLGGTEWRGGTITTVPICRIGGV